MLERSIERLIYASRWVLAPVYLGMSMALIALSIKFFQELIHFLPHVLEIKESDLVLNLLSLIDLTLVGSLLVIVMFSGYENFGYTRLRFFKIKISLFNRCYFFDPFAENIHECSGNG